MNFSNRSSVGVAYQLRVALTGGLCIGVEMNASLKPPLTTALPLIAMLVWSGCTAHFQFPMTSEELAQHNSVDALVAYLGQPDANAVVCAPEKAPPTLRNDGDLAPAMISALRQGKISPPVWGQCVAAMLPSMDNSHATQLLERIIRSEADLLEWKLETNPPLQAQLTALHRTYMDRGPGIGASPRVLDDVLSKLRPKVAAHQLGPFAQAIGAELILAIDLERGTWSGREVDIATLDALALDADEATLLACARRLPNPALRSEAERRIVRLRIARSPFPEVRNGATAVEETVMRSGANPLSLSTHPPLHATLDPVRLSERRIVVQQELNTQSAKLLGVSSDRPSLSILPELPLRGALLVELTEVTQPITVCAAGRALDPTPCLAPADLSSASPLARVDGDGTLRFLERVSEDRAVALARQGSALDVPLLIGDKPLVQISWWVWFAKPQDIVLTGDGDGPNLAVEVERLSTPRLVYSVTGAGRTVQAVVEWADAKTFWVISRGAQGARGSDGSSGSDGMSGLSGSSASCPSLRGSDGSPGGAGGDGGGGSNGGPGGRGGNIYAVVSGPSALREETMSLLRATIASQGGEGGAGGSGGSGGRGGSGGSGGIGTTCTDSKGNTRFIDGGMDGPNGPDGRRGSDGFPGPPGAPGVLRYEWWETAKMEQS